MQVRFPGRPAGAHAPATGVHSRICVTVEIPLLAAHRWTAPAVLWSAVAGLLWAALGDGGDLGRIDAVGMQVQAAGKFKPRRGGQFGVSPRLREWRGGPHQRGNERGPGAGRVQLWAVHSLCGTPPAHGLSRRPVADHRTGIGWPPRHEPWRYPFTGWSCGIST